MNLALLLRQVIEHYSDPRNGRYHQVLLAEHGETIAAHTIDQLALALDELFR